MNIYSVYRIKNMVNEKSYIGCTKDFAQRIKAHIKKTKNQYKLYKAFDDFGVDNFDFIVIKTFFDKTEAFKYEKEMIEKYNSIENGYNSTKGGIGGDTFSGMSEEEKKEKLLKMRLSMKGKHAGIKNPMYGVVLSKETIEKKRKSMIGKNAGSKNGMFISVSKDLYNSIIELRKSTGKGRKAISEALNISESIVRRILNVEGFTKENKYVR